MSLVWVAIGEDRIEKEIMKSISRHLVVSGLLAGFRHTIVDEDVAGGIRHRFAVARASVGEALQRGGDGATVGESFRCPLAGEYVVAVLYDRDLAAIDVAFPMRERTFAERVTVAMKVGIGVRLVDEKTGEALEATKTLSAVFEVSTKGHRWSGERLSTYRLEADRGYRLEEDFDGVNDDWLSPDPTVVVDPGAELQKSLVWQKRFGGR